MSEFQLKQLLHQSIAMENDDGPEWNGSANSPQGSPRAERKEAKAKAKASVAESKAAKGLSESEREQATALKSWDMDADDNTPSPTATSHTQKESDAPTSTSKTSPPTSPGRSSSGKVLLRPHKDRSKGSKKSKGKRKSSDKKGRTKVSPENGDSPFHHRAHLDKGLLTSIGKLGRLEHGVQRVRAGRNPVSAVAFEHHGMRMFVATERGEATVWPSAAIGLPSGHEVQCQPNPNAHVTACHFEGGKVATGYDDGRLMVFNANNGKRIMNSGKGAGQGLKNPGKITVTSISSDGKLVMLGGGGYKNNDRRGWLYIREIESGKRLFGFVGGAGPKDAWRNIDEDGDGVDDDDEDEEAFVRRKSSVGLGGDDSSKPKRRDSAWNLAKSSKSMLLFVQRKPTSTFSSVPRACDFMTMSKTGWPRTIAWGGRDKHVNVWKLLNPATSKTEMMHTFIDHNSIGALVFSPDASLLCLGTHGGTLKIYEAESGVLVQSFKDKVAREDDAGARGASGGKSGVATTGAGISDDPNRTKITKVIIVKEAPAVDSEDSGAVGAAKKIGGALTLGLLQKAANLKSSASYNNDLVVYVHELRKPAMCHILVRDIVSGALIHAYDIYEAQSAYAIWASQTSVILASKPRSYSRTKVEKQTLALTAMGKGGTSKEALRKVPTMVLAVRDLDMSTVQSVVNHKGGGHKGAIVASAVSNDGSRIALGERSGRVAVYACSEGEKHAVACVAIASEGHIASLVFLPTNAQLLICAGTSEGSTHGGAGSMARPEAKKNAPDRLNARRGSVMRLDGSKKGVGYVTMRDVSDKDATGTSTVLWREHYPIPVTCVELDASSRLLAVCLSVKNGSVGSCMLVNPLDGLSIRTLEHPKGVITCHFQPVSVFGMPEMLVTAGHDGMLSLWCASTLEDRSDYLRTSHEDHCVTVAFSPNGLYLVSGDVSGCVMLREFSFKRDQITLIQKQRWEMAGRISKCVFLDAGRHRSMYLGFSWWSKEHDGFRSRFKSMLAPTFPDHLWWSAIVDEAGGDIVGTVAAGTRGLLVEDIANNRISTMDLTTTCPSPTEMPLRGKDCGQWICASPHLIHRQDRSKSGQTVLHILCDGTYE